MSKPWRRLGETFDRVATRFGRWMSNPITFLTVFTAILGWTIAGLFLGFAGEWFSTIHLTGPVVTLLLVFLLQHGQAKNTRALQLKLDELIATQAGARKSTIKAEQGLTNDMERMERGRGSDGARPDNVQDTPTGAQGRRKVRASKRQRNQARRNPGKRRRGPSARPRTRAPRLRGQGR